MGLFSKKPGGTFFGNLLRGVSSKVSGGILGQGANMIPLNQTTVDPNLQAQANQAAVNLALSQAAAGAAGVPVINSAIKAGIWAEYKTQIIAVGAAIVALIVWLAVRKKSGGRSRY